jgi:ATP-dependent phosphoenolpyruvate carboxykinase
LLLLLLSPLLLLLLLSPLQKHGTHAWLVNTGWTGGRYGVGQRMSIAHTRSIIDAIHSGELETAEYIETPIFHLKVGLIICFIICFYWFYEMH